jgi:hypothetical protein
MGLSLPHVNAVLFALLLIVNANQDAFSPATAANATPDIPIAPAPFAFLIWPVIYVFTSAHVFTDCFLRDLSLYELSDSPTELRLCFTASCVLNMLWIALNNWLQWINVATFDLLLLKASLAPIYMLLIQRKTPFEWRRYLVSELAIHLYFAWVVVAMLLCLTQSLQDFNGAYLSFDTYVVLLVFLMEFGLCGVVYALDPVMGLVVMWALFGLASRSDISTDPTLQHTNELLRACASLGGPLTSLMIFASILHQRQQYVPKDLVLGRFNSVIDLSVCGYRATSKGPLSWFQPAPPVTYGSTLVP